MTGAQSTMTTVKPLSDEVALPQECVGDSAVGKENMAPSRKRDGGTKDTTEVKVRQSHGKALGRTSVGRPMILTVMGRHWSTNVYKNARLAGLSRDRAWTEAFV